MYVFPSIKRFIKRMIGLPGDIIYFYGGKVYGIDKDGNPIKDFENVEWNKNLEYIPILTFEGSADQNTKSQIDLKLMNQTVGKVTHDPFKGLQGYVFDGKDWIKDETSVDKKGVHSLSDLWGIGNFAKVKLLTKKEAEKEGLKQQTDAPYYLEFSHHPSYSQWETTKKGGMKLKTEKSFLPMSLENVQKLMDHMYTARFVIKKGKGGSYNQGNGYFSPHSPTFDGVPDGTYELYYGKGYEVKYGGYLSELEPKHPLLSRDPKNVQKLFNAGIELDESASEDFPMRFAYFRDGNLYLLGTPFLTKDDPLLVSFVDQEKIKKIPFIDQKPPVDDPEFIKTFGLKIPEKNYLVLGDNHAMSSDSRVFGFVPEDNLQGTPSLIIWPPGDRFGLPSMIRYPLLTTPRLIVWSIAGVIFLAWWLWRRRKWNQPLNFN